MQLQLSGRTFTVDNKKNLFFFHQRKQHIMRDRIMITGTERIRRSLNNLLNYLIYDAATKQI